MSKAIKVIDLLNMIANEEEVPKVIEFNGCQFKYTKNTNKYYLINGNSDLFDYISCGEKLNTEVEIIEEQPEMDIQSIKAVEIKDIVNIDGYAPERIKNKINILITALKELDKRIKKLEE